MNRICGFAVAALALASVAAAQETKPIGVSLKFGQFQPQGREAKNEGKRWVFLGMDTKIRDMKYEKGRGEYLTASVDYFSKGDMSSIPVMVNWVNRTNEWYFMAGAGLAFTEDFRVVSSERVSDDSIELAYSIGVGYDFQWAKSPLFGEVRFMGNGNDRLNGFAVSIGVRL